MKLLLCSMLTLVTFVSDVATTVYYLNRST